MEKEKKEEIKEQYEEGQEYYEETEEHKCCGKCHEGKCCKDEE